MCTWTCASGCICTCGLRTRVSARVSMCLCVCPMCMAHLNHVHVLTFFGGFTVSTLDTHVFPIQARLAILAWLSLWEQIIGQKSGLG